jgi:2-oxo-3-hexenedioate decarboxylase
LTKAMPVVAGEVWTAAATGIALDVVQLRFT